jgi:integrase/recombinase XerC
MDQQTVRVLGKGKKERIVLFGSFAARALLDYRTAKRKLNLEKSRRIAARLAEFVSIRGKRLSSRDVQRLVATLRLRLKTTRRVDSPYVETQLCHPSTGAWCRSACHPGTARHESLATTQKYTHVGIQHLKREYDKAHPKAKGSSGS